MMFDTHCHLNDERFTDDLKETVMRALAADVTYIVVPGVDVKSSERAVAISEQFEGVFAAVGIHPEAAKDVPAADYDHVRALAEHDKVVAIGEIGLDYYWDAAPREEQREVMEIQMEMAASLGLPVVIHNRDATEDTVRIALSWANNGVRGVMHCFTGSLEVARQCIDAGYYISFGGPLTFKNAHRVREVCQGIPLDSLLVETDSPYLTPEPHRGKRNEPSYVRYVASKMAEVHGLPENTVEVATRENGLRLFTRITSP